MANTAQNLKDAITSTQEVKDNLNAAVQQSMTVNSRWGRLSD